MKYATRIVTVGPPIELSTEAQVRREYRGFNVKELAERAGMADPDKSAAPNGLSTTILLQA